MKIYVNEALRRDLISKNPYDGIKIESGKSTKRKFLTEDEIIKIKECTYSGPYPFTFEGNFLA